MVLLDLKMPKINGLEVLKAIKADEHLKTIPVVVLTSSRETQDLAECYRHGANAYVVKPVEYAEFKRAVNSSAFSGRHAMSFRPSPGKKYSWAKTDGQNTPTDSRAGMISTARIPRPNPQPVEPGPENLFSL